MPSPSQSSTQSKHSLYLPDEDATVALGARLGQAAGDGAIIYLEGQLGAGKTTLCRGLLTALGHRGAVKSPTYTLVEPYELSERQVYHFDLYRLGDPEELEYLGVRDYFAPGSLCLIEWPSRGAGFLPVADLTVKVTLASPGTSPGSESGPGRSAELIAESTVGQQVLTACVAEPWPW